jgi:hypothetical protein
MSSPRRLLALTVFIFAVPVSTVNARGLGFGSPLRAPVGSSGNTRTGAPLLFFFFVIRAVHDRIRASSWQAFR